MRESKYLTFEFREQLPKTKVWEVCRKSEEYSKDSMGLGLIKYFGAWRQYAFFPFEGTVWNPDCMLDIIAFIKEQNELRKSNLLSGRTE